MGAVKPPKHQIQLARYGCFRIGRLYSQEDDRKDPAPVIVKAYEEGCIFDAWNETFKYDKWLWKLLTNAMWILISTQASPRG